MVVRVRLQPVNLDITVAFGGMLSDQHRSKMLADYACEKLAEADARNEAASGYVPEHDTFVDGVAEAPLENVKPDGVIVFRFHLINQIFPWIIDMLEQHSPVKSGLYEKSHAFYADGVEADPAEAPEAGQYIFVNLQPYSPKIERGESPAAPEGVYEGVAAMAQAKFGSLARISFGYVFEPSGAVRRPGPRRGALPRVSARRAARVVGAEINQPAIIISVRQS
jgi:hypothetical protein